MQLPGINLSDYQNDNGNYNKNVADALELIYGEPIGKLEEQADTTPEPPSGHPSTWQKDAKLAYIKEAGRENFEKICRERS